MVNPYVNMQMCEEMRIDSLGASHPLPSIGFTALYHMQDFPVSIYVCGFNWYFDKTKRVIQGHEIGNYDYPKNWNHNYPKEVYWIIDNLMKKDNIIFSESCHNTLSYIRNKIIKPKG